MSRRSSIAFPIASDSVVLLTRVRINRKCQQNALSRLPLKEHLRRESEPSQGSTADSNETNLDVSASSPAPSEPDPHNDSDGVDHDVLWKILLTASM